MWSIQMLAKLGWGGKKVDILTEYLKMGIAEAPKKKINKLVVQFRGDAEN